MAISIVVFCTLFYTLYCVHSVSVNVVFVLWLAFALMLQVSHGKWSSPRLKMRIAQYNISKKK